MTGYFFDSSTIVKRYVQEAGTAWVRRMTRTRQTGADLPGPHFGGGGHVGRSPPPSGREFGRGPCKLNPVAISHGLRAYDAVQLAAALEIHGRWLSGGLGGMTLVSSDRELNAAAAVEGLKVDDPSTHA